MFYENANKFKDIICNKIEIVKDIMDVMKVDTLKEFNTDVEIYVNAQ